MVKLRRVLDADVRANLILIAAIKVARAHGWEAMTRDNVAEEADCAVGTINNMYGTMDDLRHSVMQYTIDLIRGGDESEELLIIVGKGLSDKYIEAVKAPTAVKKLVFRMMAS